MVDKVNFKGFITLAPKVEKTIIEKEFFALQQKFKDLPYDVFVKKRILINETPKNRDTFFECYSIPGNQTLSTLVKLDK